MRNIWCPRYGEYLIRAAMMDSDGFTCDGCPRVGDAGGWVRDPAIAEKRL